MSPRNNLHPNAAIRRTEPNHYGFVRRFRARGGGDGAQGALRSQVEEKQPYLAPCASCRGRRRLHHAFFLKNKILRRFGLTSSDSILTLSRSHVGGVPCWRIHDLCLRYRMLKRRIHTTSSTATACRAVRESGRGRKRGESERVRESFGIKRQCGIISGVCACKLRGGCCSPFLRSRISQDAVRSRQRRSTEDVSTERKVLEPNLDLGGGDGGVSQHFLLVEKATKTNQERSGSSSTWRLRHDEISTQNTGQQNNEAQPPLSREKDRLPRALLPPKTYHATRAEWSLDKAHQQQNPNTEPGTTPAVLQRNQCALTCSLSCVDSWQNHELRSWTVSLLLFHPRWASSSSTPMLSPCL